MMGRVLLKSVVRHAETEKLWSDADTTTILNVKVPLNNSTSLDQDVTIRKIDGKWFATVELDSFPSQETPECAMDKLSQWLLALSKGIKGKNIKHLKISEMFKPRNF